MKAEKNKSQISVSSIDDEVSGRLSINSVKTKTLKNSTSVSNSDRVQLATCNKNIHIRNEIADAVPCKKAKLLRIERKKNKLLAQGKSQSEIETIMKEKKQQNCAKTMEEIFEEVYTGLKKLEVIWHYWLNFEIIILLNVFLTSVTYEIAFFFTYYTRYFQYGPLFSNFCRIKDR